MALLALLRAEPVRPAFLADFREAFLAGRLADRLAAFLPDFLAAFFAEGRLAAFRAGFRAVFLPDFFAPDFFALDLFAPDFFADLARGRDRAGREESESSSRSLEEEATDAGEDEGAGGCSVGSGSIHPEPDQPISI
ncbi:MAG: hypothetical protein H0V43_01445 [Gemmatimonadales bacterium]|nr:hypothetical protein [Gemmatimonadales bacterium]MBA3555666.1 hypothetical protein [Gemmatimonadales bacterium]